MMERVMCLSDDQIPRSEYWVLLAVAHYADDLDGRNAYPSTATLAAEARFSHRNTVRLLDKLQARGFLALDAPAAQHRAKTFRLTLPGMTPGVTPERTSARTPGVTFRALRDDISSARGDIAVSPDPCNDPCTDPKSSGAVAPPSPLKAAKDTVLAPNVDAILAIAKTLLKHPDREYLKPADWEHLLKARCDKVGEPYDDRTIRQALEALGRRPPTPKKGEHHDVQSRARRA